MVFEGVHDQHTLHVKCSDATAEELYRYFHKVLAQASSILGPSTECRFKVNLITTRDGISTGLCYVYVSQPQVYNLLLGRNPDGSARVELIDDPSWVAPVKGQDVNESGWAAMDAGASWGDIMDEEQEMTCPKITCALDPMMTLPDIEREDGSTVNLVVGRAYVFPLDDKFMTNVIKCNGVPNWLTSADLKAQFAPFVSDPHVQADRHHNKQQLNETYPHVNIVGTLAFIIFNPATHDAQFALHMMKRAVINKRNPDGGPPLSTTLIFNHAYRSDRDLPSNGGGRRNHRE